ncbi:UpaP162 family type II restriction enzyme [Mycoplasmopsis cynos]|nr:hypothetical protein [Mycoplasmopsis cynos]
MINWKDLNNIKNFLESELKNIFKVYDNKIEIKAEDLNILKSSNSCIRSSTAIGYILEEFIYQKMKNVIKYNDMFQIYRNNTSTQSSSYDFLIASEKFDLLINIKTENKNSNNNAIAAIKQLYKNYNNHFSYGKDFYFILVKIKYEIDGIDYLSKKINHYDKVKITGFDIFALEEISFENGFIQDHRNWGKEYKSVSGRLQISKKFYLDNKLEESDEISNYRTLVYIENIYGL